MADRKTVMISSIVDDDDFADYREQVKEACLRQGMFPSMMEHLPASDAEAVFTSIDLVTGADIFIGIFGHRYGYIPKYADPDNTGKGNPQGISITEIEYNRAVERRIPRLIFVMDKSRSVVVRDEGDRARANHKAFIERLKTENIVNSFKLRKICGRML